MALTQVKTLGIADDAVTQDKVANDAIDITELKGRTDGHILTYDASGNPTSVGPGTDGQVLTSTGAGSPPAFEALPASNNYTHPNHSGDVTSSGDGATTIADNAVTLAKMAGLARGKIIYGDASGDPAALTVGSSGQVLKSDGTDIAWGTDSGGKILGYAKVDTTAGTDCSAFATFTTISNFTLTYQPTASNSKLLFMATLHLTVRAVNSSYYGNMEVQFVHGSHGVTSELISLYQGPGSGAATAHTWPTTFIFEIDAVNTDSRDITVQIHNASMTGGNNNGHLYINEYPGRSFMSVMEIAQ